MSTRLGHLRTVVTNARGVDPGIGTRDVLALLDVAEAAIAFVKATSGWSGYQTAEFHRLCDALESVSSASASGGTATSTLSEASDEGNGSVQEADARVSPRLPDFEHCSVCGADAKTYCSWDPADGWCCSNCGGCDSDEGPPPGYYSAAEVARRNA